jgi:hypothetical protein
VLGVEVVVLGVEVVVQLIVEVVVGPYFVLAGQVQQVGRVGS